MKTMENYRLKLGGDQDYVECRHNWISYRKILNIIKNKFSSLFFFLFVRSKKKEGGD